MPASHDDIGLHRWPSLAALPSGSRDALRALAEGREVPAGTTLFTTGQEDGTRLFALAEGEARLTNAADGGEVTVTALGAGAIVGLKGFALGEDLLSAASLESVSPCRFVLLDAAALKKLCLEDGAVAFALFEIAATALESQAAAPPRKRVYRALLRLKRREGERIFVPHLPRHAVIGAEAGVSDVDAAGAIAVLLQSGIARRRYPDLDILDEGALERAAYG